MTILCGASAPAFSNHPGYRRMFAPDRLTLGIFLPLRFWRGDMAVLRGQGDLITDIDQRGFAAVWLRDVPLFDPAFGDAGQVFDPFTYMAWLAAKTSRITLATGSAVFTLRNPIDLAKMATTVDQLSGGRLVMGIASGDRPVEFPAYGIDFDSRATRFAENVQKFRQLVGEKPAMLHGADLLPKPVTGRIPLIITGSSRQPVDWIATHADGWLTYPHATDTPEGPRQLGQKIRDWRSRIPGGRFRPHMTNEWLDLVDDVNFPRTPINGGYILRTGRKGLIELLEQWQQVGVNHAALGIQFAARPAADIIQELAEDVLPRFPSCEGPEVVNTNW